MKIQKETGVVVVYDGIGVLNEDGSFDTSEFGIQPVNTAVEPSSLAKNTWTYKGRIVLEPGQSPVVIDF